MAADDKNLGKGKQTNNLAVSVSLHSFYAFSTSKRIFGLIYLLTVPKNIVFGHID